MVRQRHHLGDGPSHVSPQILVMGLSVVIFGGLLQACGALIPTPAVPDTPVPAASTSTSEMLPPSPVPTEETCTGIDSPWVSAKPTGERGWCKLRGVVEEGSTYDYSLVYPGNWTVTLFGVLSPNLRFLDESTGVEMSLFSFYLQVSEERRPELERSDETLSCDEKGNCLPVVGPDEVAVSREVRTLGSHEVLVLQTTEGDNSHLRYFTLLKHGGEQTSPEDVNRLYVIHFAFSTAQLEAGQYAELTETAEKMVASLKPEW